jgi:hypothetical protein
MRISYCVLYCAIALITAGGHAADGKSDGFSVGDRLAQSKSAPAADGYKEITWDALIPADWDPVKAFKKLDLSKLKDSDPQAMEAMDRLKKAWDEAPVETKMNGARIRIPGFIVSLGTDLDHVKEFLLVPYFGACIHVPPPPANQIIHVISDKPFKTKTSMDAVWVNGTLATVNSRTDMGNSGYQLKAHLVEEYKEPRK